MVIFNGDIWKKNKDVDTIVSFYSSFPSTNILHVLGGARGMWEFVDPIKQRLSWGYS